MNLSPSTQPSTARRHVAALLAALVVATTLAAGRPATVEAAIALRSGFTDTAVWSGLNRPTVVQFAPNGNVFVAEKSGIIKRFSGLSDTTPDIAADLRNQVFNYWDKGLLGMAVHPQYPSQPYIYALYSYLDSSDPIQADWHRSSGDDNCPSPPAGPGSSTPNDGCTTRGRLSRITLNSSGVMTSQTTFMTDWCNQFPSHSIGALAFGKDGYLYATGGDGASLNPNDRDYGQFGGTITNPDTNQPYTPRNPCGDPPGGVGGAMTLPTAQGGSLRSQDRRTSGDSLGLSGTLIRINPSNGAPAPTNPAFGSGSTNNQRILGYGLRNPFRIAFRPGTNDVYIGDVGSNYFEEINRYPASATNVRNYGWPCYEGKQSGQPKRHPGWDATNVSLCETLYDQGASAVTTPYYNYPWNSQVPGSDGNCSLTGGGSIAGLAFYPGGNYPAAYDNALFWTDYSRRCIWAMQAGSNGLPDATKILRFVNDAGTGAVDLKSGPGGDIFWVEIGSSSNTGKIHRISYSSGNVPPTIVATANPTSGPAPLTVNYDASGSFDPNGGDTISFAWDLDGDGQYDDATGSTASRSYAKGDYDTGVRATDNHGASATKSFFISSGNEPPDPVINSPAQGFTWSVNQNISFSGSATDPDEGTLAASRLTWEIVLHHCSAPSSCHEHLINTITGAASGSFAAPDHEYPAFLELRLTARDSAGLTATVNRELQPKTVNLTFASSPAGLRLTAGDDQRSAPFSGTYIVGSHLTVGAPTPQSLSGITYAYSSWSDGGARNHTITAPGSNTTYTATFSRDAPNSCANATSNSAQGTWLMETLSSGSDVDWYRFNLSQTGWVRIVLGSLPRNYRLDLYTSCGTRIATSNAGSRQFEEMYRKLSAGTYRVRVKSSAGSFDAGAQYGLRLERMPAGLRVLSSNSWTGGGNLRIHGEVLNNRGYNQRLVTVQATFYNAANSVLGTASTQTYLDVLKARTRSPFSIVVPTPANYDHYTLAVSGQQTSQSRVGRLKILSQSSAAGGSGLSVTGSIRNNNSFRVVSARTAITLYDKWANVLNTSKNPTSPTTINAGASATFAALFADHFSGWNWQRIQRQAYR